MKISNVSVCDIDEIVKYEQLYFDSSLGYDYINNDLNNPYARYIKALEDDKLVGYISINVDTFGEVLNFFVIEGYRNKGIGQMLFDAALTHFRDNKCKSVSLEVKETNMGAIKFYEKNGFKKNHIRYNYYKDHSNAILMIKEME